MPCHHIDSIRAARTSDVRPMQDLMAPFVENYLDFLTIFVNDDKPEYQRLAKNMESRLDKIAAGPSNSPWYLYTQAEIRLQWAITRSRYSDFLTSMSDIKQAYALLEENQRKFPDFMANKKSLGIMHAMIGNVPEEYRWAVKALGGMNGTMEQGLRELEESLEYAKKNDFIFEDEAVVAYALLQLYLNNQGDLAWKTLKNSKLNPKTNPMAAYLMASVAMRTGQNDEAVRLLEECPTGPQYAPLHFRNYLLGLAKLRRLDGDANKALEVFVNNFKGENGLKEAYQKLAWHHLLSGNENGYRTYMGYVKIKGSSNGEGDEAADRQRHARAPGIGAQPGRVEDRQDPGVPILSPETLLLDPRDVDGVGARFDRARRASELVRHVPVGLACVSCGEESARVGEDEPETVIARRELRKPRRLEPDPRPVGEADGPALAIVAPHEGAVEAEVHGVHVSVREVCQTFEFSVERIGVVDGRVVEEQKPSAEPRGDLHDGRERRRRDLAGRPHAHRGRTHRLAHRSGIGPTGCNERARFRRRRAQWFPDRSPACVGRPDGGTASAIRDRHEGSPDLRLAGPFAIAGRSERAGQRHRRTPR